MLITAVCGTALAAQTLTFSPPVNPDVRQGTPQVTGFPPPSGPNPRAEEPSSFVLRVTGPNAAYTVGAFTPWLRIGLPSVSNTCNGQGLVRVLSLQVSAGGTGLCVYAQLRTGFSTGTVLAAGMYTGVIAFEDGAHRLQTYPIRAPIFPTYGFTVSPLEVSLNFSKTTEVITIRQDPTLNSTCPTASFTIDGPYYLDRERDWLSLSTRSGTTNNSGSSVILRSVADISSADLAYLYINRTETPTCPASSVTLPVSLDLTGRQAPSVTTRSVPFARVGRPYLYQLEASNCGANCTFRLAQRGNLPTEIVLSSSGALSGTPVRDGSGITFAVVASNGAQESEPQQLGLAIYFPVQVTADALPDGAVGQRYGPRAIQASRGVPPYAFSQRGLPADLTLTDRGILSGDPKQPGEVRFTVQASDSTGDVSDPVEFRVNISGRAGPAVQNAASAGAFGGSPRVTSGGWMEIFGQNLSATTRSWEGRDFASGRAPTVLDNVRVTVDGRNAFVSYISPTQVNALAPDGIGPGAVQVIVTNDAGASAGYSVTAAVRAPGLLAPPSFRASNRQYATALFADGAFVGPPDLVPGALFRRAVPGDSVVFYAIGCGATNPASPAGIVVAGNATLPNVLVRFGERTGRVAFAGLAPGLVGLYQLNVVVPEGVTGDTPLTLSVDGVVSAQALLFAAR